MSDFASQSNSNVVAINPFELSPRICTPFIYERQQIPLAVGLQNEPHVHYASKKRRSISKQADSHKDSSTSRSKKPHAGISLVPPVLLKTTNSYPAQSGGCHDLCPTSVRPHNKLPESNLLGLAIEKLLDIADRIPFIGVKNTNSKVINSCEIFLPVLILDTDFSFFHISCGILSPVHQNPLSHARNYCNVPYGSLSNFSQLSRARIGPVLISVPGKGASVCALLTTSLYVYA